MTEATGLRPKVQMQTSSLQAVFLGRLWTCNSCANKFPKDISVIIFFFLFSLRSEDHSSAAARL